MRVRWWHVGLIGAVALVVVLGFAAAWLVRKPAPAPAGMAARLEAEQRAFIESVWPEGEAAWPLLERALAAEGVERVRLAIEAAERARLYLDIDSSPGAGTSFHTVLSATVPGGFFEIRRVLDRDVWQSMADGDLEGASAALRASRRVDAYLMQHPGVVASMMICAFGESTLTSVTDALRQAEIDPLLCEALINALQEEPLAARAVQAPFPHGARLEEQRGALAMRAAVRDMSIGKRMRARFRSLQPRGDGFDRMAYFEDDWLLWSHRYDASEMERVIDEYFDAIETWWATRALQRSTEPDYPGDTGSGPWITSRQIWPNARFALDQLAMQEAGVILLLRIEAYQARTGEWPAALEDAAPAEEIIDPVTGRAFVYEVVEDPAPGAWPFVLRAPLTVEEYSRLMMLGEDSRPVEALWREAVTITKEGEEE